MFNCKFYNLIVVALSLFIFSCSTNNMIEYDDLDSNISSIYGGTEDTNPAHEAVVSLFYVPQNTSYCTGTLIAPRWVLTAGHCVVEYGKIMPEALKYKIGVGNNEKQLSYNLHDIEGIYPHENYDGYSDGNDIALIHLKHSIYNVEPIKPLPPDIGFSKDNVSNSDVNVEFVGFGYDENRDYGTKLTFTGKVSHYCGEEYDSEYGCTYSGDSMPFGSIYYTQREGGPCNGDSGGPAFLTVDNVEYVAGITSYGDSWCTIYGVSTAVQNFYDWIVNLTVSIGDPLIINEVDNNESNDNNESDAVDSGNVVIDDTDSEQILDDNIYNGNQGNMPDDQDV